VPRHHGEARPIPSKDRERVLAAAIVISAVVVLFQMKAFQNKHDDNPLGRLDAASRCWWHPPS
jgi:hypothetical protein